MEHFDFTLSSSCLTETMLHLLVCGLAAHIIVWVTQKLLRTNYVSSYLEVRYLEDGIGLTGFWSSHHTDQY